MIKEFTEFLKLYGVMGLAIAVIIGGKLNDLVTAVVGGLLMPIVGVVAPAGDWRNLKMETLGIKFEIGKVMGAGIDFLLVALIVFWIARKIMKEDLVTKK